MWWPCDVQMQPCHIRQQSTILNSTSGLLEQDVGPFHFVRTRETLKLTHPTFVLEEFSMARTRTVITLTATTASVASIMLAGSVLDPASASDDFGKHVVACAQGAGLDGSHNPGMHRGYAGWDPSHSC